MVFDKMIRELVGAPVSIESKVREVALLRFKVVLVCSCSICLDRRGETRMQNHDNSTASWFQYSIERLHANVSNSERQKMAATFKPGLHLDKTECPLERSY
jgi:hypothetical protein